MIVRIQHLIIYLLNIKTNSGSTQNNGQCLMGGRSAVGIFRFGASRFCALYFKSRLL